ncbi:MAG: M50 family metallopeptidase [Armatimonadota bacterium]
MTILLSIFTFIVMFAILVAVHEWGHYLAARHFRMAVSEFSIGFGPKVKTWRQKLTRMPNEDQITTDFNVRSVPLGGFVKIEGMEPQPDGSETKIMHGFYSKPPTQRIAVLFAGPLFSIIFGVLVIFFTVVAFGIDKPSNLVEQLKLKYPAVEAGIKPGDRILKVNGEPTTEPFAATVAIRKSTSGSVQLEVDRSGTAMKFSVPTKLSEEAVDLLDADGLPTGVKAKVPQLGIVFGAEKVRMPVGEALSTAVEIPIISVQRLLYRLTQPAKIIEETTGVVGMAAVTNKAVESGLDSVLTICGMISISLGITNLLPIGMLDGGQILLAIVELFNRGKRLSYKLQTTFLTAGMAFMLVLFLLITRQDIIRWVLPK